MPGLDSCGFGVQNPEGIIEIHGGIALDTVCNNVVCRYHTCNVQCGRGREKKRVLPNKVSDFPYVGELSADLSFFPISRSNTTVRRLVADRNIHSTSSSTLWASIRNQYWQRFPSLAMNSI